MVNRNIDSILYQSTIKLGDITLLLAKYDSIGVEEETMNQNDLWQTAINIYSILRTINSSIEIQSGLFYKTLDITDEELNTLLAKLVNIANITNYPVPSSIVLGSPVNVLIGLPGADGNDGATGPQGPAGYATDYLSANKTANTTIDTFTIGSAKSVRWDYIAVDSLGNQRTSSIIAQWKSDGSTLTFTDTFGPEDIGTISGITFDVQHSAGNINLIAVITSGTWTISGTRYFIPNNGNGSGAVNNVLPLAQIYIGNSSNQATPQTLSQDATLNAAGQLLISAGAVNNAKIAANAGIVMTKLAALTAQRVTITDINGFITASTILASELAYLSGVDSNIQDQLDALAVSLIANRPVITDGSGALSSNPALSSNRIIKWNGTQFVDSLIQDDGTNVTVNGTNTISGIFTALNKIIANTSLEVYSGIRHSVSGPFIKKTDPIPIPSWNMDTVVSITVPHGIINYKKIRSVQIIIRDNADTLYTPLEYISAGGIVSGTWSINGSDITLTRSSLGQYDQASYNATGFIRGYITIEYEL